MLANIICYCKMTSVMALDDVTLFLCLKDIINATQSNYWRYFLSAMVESWKELKTSNVFSSFIEC